jgi:branched-chain amino acid transport system permease protein
VIQAVVSGVFLGCFYALVALGFSLILATSRALNLAHGDLVILGGYIGYWLWAGAGIHPLLAVPVAAAALLPLGILWRWLLERIPEPRELPSLVLTFGLSLLLQNLARAAGHGEYRLITDPTLGAGLTVGRIHLNLGRVVVAAVALAAVLLLWLGLTRMRWGRAVRATGIDRAGAALVGINVDRAVDTAFLAAVGLAGATGVLFATLHYVYPAAGVELTLTAIVLAIWAGVGRVRSVLVAGLLLGVIEALTVGWIGPGWREPAVALLLLASLLARSGGLARGIGAHGSPA